MNENDTEKTITCFNCHSGLSFDQGYKISRREQCSHCSTDLHCCKMCQFYDATAYNECREPMASRILEKEKANFCDYFILSGQKNEKSKKEDLISTANSLFKSR